jgi:hypothetical protein
MDARRTPQWVGTAHGTDQVPDFLRDGGPSGLFRAEPSKSKTT